MNEVQPKPAKKKKGILKKIFLGILVLVLILVLGFFRVPQMVIPGNAATKHLSSTPDYVGGRELLREAQRKGFPTQGVELYVIPIKNSDASIAYATLDASKGFSFRGIGSLENLADMMNSVVSGPKANELNVSHFGAAYSPDGEKEAFTLSAPRDAILALANSPSEETEHAFMKALDISINPAAGASLSLDYFLNLQ